jgi:hypothetical protein
VCSLAYMSYPAGCEGERSLTAVAAVHI